MLYLNFENLAKIGKTHGITRAEILAQGKLIEKYLREIESKNQGFYTIIDDKSQLQNINKYAKKVEGKYKDIVVLGIGGSALGTLCLKHALRYLPNKSKAPKLHIVTNIDPVKIKKIESDIDFKKTLFIVISKSGSTIETISQYLYFRQKCKDKKLKITDHFVFVTDEKEGILRMIADKEKITSFDVPKNIEGRFSVLTVVGLLPARLIGIKIEELIEGAKRIRDEFLKKNIEENTPFQLAAIQYLLAKKGKNINVLMPYSQELDFLSIWYTQLLAESIGKKGNGITPLRALGVSDQHSQIQLFNDGPNDKLIMFIEVEKLSENLYIPNSHPELKEFELMNKKISFNRLLELEKQGTEMALTHNNRPNITIKIPKVSEENLGELFMLFETSVAFLGEFYKIYAFDQPAVELGKKFTKELLLKEYL
jgi:glucose-6-phosphate isomerase